MVRHAVALGLVSAFVATAAAQVVLGDGKGGIVGVNSLANSSSSGTARQWSRNLFQDATNNEVYGFFPAFTIQVPGTLFDIFSGNENLGNNDNINDLVTITPVEPLVQSYGWPNSFTMPRYLFRQGGANTNVSRSGDHSVRGRVWIVYQLDNSNPNGWNVTQVQVFAWDVRDIIHKSSLTKNRVFSDTQAPYQIDVYVSSSQTVPNPNVDPQDAPATWTYVGSLSKANGTLPNVCEWNASTGNTFGECPEAMLQFLSGQNPEGVRFYENPTHPIWYSKLNVRGQRNVRYVALVIPLGNQYGQDPTLAASTNAASSLQFTNITDVRVIAGPVGPEGDVNGDGCVNDSDLLIVLFNFGQSGQGDVNGDGVVNDSDLLVVLFNFGQGC